MSLGLGIPGLFGNGKQADFLIHEFSDYANGVLHRAPMRPQSLSREGKLGRLTKRCPVSPDGFTAWRP